MSSLTGALPAAPAEPEEEPEAVQLLMEGLAAARPSLQDFQH